jgi:tellurite resistance protein TerC
MFTLAPDILSSVMIAQDAAGGMSPQVWFYVGFIALVCFFLALDLGVFNRKSHEVSMREALMWTGVWVSCALAFAVGVYFIYDNHWLGIGQNVVVVASQPARDVGGMEATGLYLTAWMLEYALSMDNIFVMALVFKAFLVPRLFQHRVLFWGIIGALVLRGLMIWVGAELVHRFVWIEYVFGAFLVLTGLKMLKGGDSDVDPEKNWVTKLARRFMNVSPRIEGEKFFTRFNGKFAVTPLFVVLLVIESTDVVFAVDSIPAVFGVTRDPFIVFTSNIFAILGLRSLYFALSSLMGKFDHLKYALAGILIFIGLKMLALYFEFHLSPVISLSIIALSLVGGVVSSIMFGGKGEKHNLPEDHPGEEVEELPNELPNDQADESSESSSDGPRSRPPSGV